MLIFIIYCVSLIMCTSELLDITSTNDRMCNPSGFDFRFSGLRVYTSTIYGVPIQHFWTVVRCNAGETTALQYFPCKRSSNFMFGKPMELDTGESYIFAREKEYASREVPLFFAYGQVGAVYSVDKKNNKTEIYAPLEADPFLSSFTQPCATGKRMTHFPFMHASLAVIKRGWSARMEVNPYEIFNYTVKDKSTKWYRINELLNTANKHTLINDRLIPWEYDSFERQFNGNTDWRRLMNPLIPDVV